MVERKETVIESWFLRSEYLKRSGINYFLSSLLCFVNNSLGHEECSRTVNIRLVISPNGWTDACEELLRNRLLSLNLSEKDEVRFLQRIARILRVNPNPR